MNIIKSIMQEQKQYKEVEGQFKAISKQKYHLKLAYPGEIKMPDCCCCYYFSSRPLSEKTKC